MDTAIDGATRRTNSHRQDIDAYLAAASAQERCCASSPAASVDDGKSTLIGRLLYDSKMIFEDQLAALEADSASGSARRARTSTSRCWSTAWPPSASRASPSTSPIVSSRPTGASSSSPTRPGHEQYTRNMVTGASTADLAVILIDARKGVLTQTRRHSYLAHLIGIRNVVLAVNKMDLVGYDQRRFDAIVADYREFARPHRHRAISRRFRSPAWRATTSPSRPSNTPWYTGRTLIEHLETVEIDVAADQRRPFRMPVQWVNRPNLDFRGFSGPDRGGADPARRCGARAAVGQELDASPHRHAATATCRAPWPASR